MYLLDTPPPGVFWGLVANCILKELVFRGHGMEVGRGRPPKANRGQKVILSFAIKVYFGDQKDKGANVEAMTLLCFEGTEP